MKSTFTDALKGQPHDYTPVWFMRQAGRHMPGFSRLIEGKSISEIIVDPNKSAEVAIEPIERLNVDAAIVFADIITPLEAAGLMYEYVAGSGPVLGVPISPEEFQRKTVGLDDDSFWFIGEQVETIKNSVDVPVIGFAGAPFTLATYIIEGKYIRESPGTKSFMLSQGWDNMMLNVNDLIYRYADVQIKSGASAIQLFDTWVGSLSERQFSQFYLGHLSKLVEKIKSRVPVIYFCMDCTHVLNSIIHNVKPTALSVDWKVSLSSIKKEGDFALQGNLDPVYALKGGKIMLTEAKRVLNDANGLNKYIFNLGHGVLPGTDWRELRDLVEYIHNS